MSEKLLNIVDDQLSASSSLEVLTSDMSLTDVSSCAEVVTSDISIAGVSSSVEVVTSEISIADVSSTDISIAEPEKKRKLPEEWVVLLQKPQPSPRPSHNVRNWRHNTQDNLYTEYNYRIYRNLIYLSESWRIQVLAEKQHHLKATVKKFENEWPNLSSKEQSRGKNHPFTSLEMKRKISHVISVLQLHWAKLTNGLINWTVLWLSVLLYNMLYCLVSLLVIWSAYRGIYCSQLCWKQFKC